MAEERVQKILARAGFGSRRSCEELITQGRVFVNGKRIELGSKADPSSDRIAVDGHPVKVQDEMLYYALNKPRGVLSDDQAEDSRRNVLDLIPPSSGHMFPVGRLDFDSEGLMLLTNDGELANRLTHPRYGHEKEYRVLVAKRPDEDQLSTWRRGVVMEDGYKTQPARVEVESSFGKGTWLRVILREGKKRQIREIGTLLGLPVVRILRVRIGSLHLGDLKTGEWRPLTPQEVMALKMGTPIPKSTRWRASRTGPPGRSPKAFGKRTLGEGKTARTTHGVTEAPEIKPQKPGVRPKRTRGTK